MNIFYYFSIFLRRVSHKEIKSIRKHLKDLEFGFFFFIKTIPGRIYCSRLLLIYAWRGIFLTVHQVDEKIFEWPGSHFVPFQVPEI